MWIKTKLIYYLILTCLCRHLYGDDLSFCQNFAGNELTLSEIYPAPVTPHCEWIEVIRSKAVPLGCFAFSSKRNKAGDYVWSVLDIHPSNDDAFNREELGPIVYTQDSSCFESENLELPRQIRILNPWPMLSNSGDTLRLGFWHHGKYDVVEEVTWNGLKERQVALENHSSIYAGVTQVWARASRPTPGIGNTSYDQNDDISLHNDKSKTLTGKIDGPSSKVFGSESPLYLMCGDANDSILYKIWDKEGNELYSQKCSGESGDELVVKWPNGGVREVLVLGKMSKLNTKKWRLIHKWLVLYKG